MKDNIAISLFGFTLHNSFEEFTHLRCKNIYITIEDFKTKFLNLLLLCKYFYSEER